MLLTAEMVPIPVLGRRFTNSQKVRLGDVDPFGRLRLDGLMRYCQDVANDDTADAGLDPSSAWIARRIELRVLSHAAMDEELDLTTFCGALGRRWAQRRVVITGNRGALYEVEALWIHIDRSSGRPIPLSDQILEHYQEAASGRTVKARLVLAKIRPAAPARPWPLRAVDFDIYNHINNAVYWVEIEELLSHKTVPECFRAAIEYGSGIGPGALVEVLSAPDANEPTSTDIWWRLGDNTVAATGRLEHVGC